MNPQVIAQDMPFLNGDPLLRQQFIAENQHNAIAPLDLAVSSDHVYQNHHATAAEISLLSPVYEAQTPSPVVSRTAMDFPGLDEKSNNGQAENKKPSWTNMAKQTSRANDQTQESQESSKPTKNQKQGGSANGPRQNGHVRGARSESDGGWQRAGKGKKKTAAEPQPANAELPPKRASERKGG
jgi:hypothetical protein